MSLVDTSAELPKFAKDVVMMDRGDARRPQYTAARDLTESPKPLSRKASVNTMPMTSNSAAGVVEELSLPVPGPTRRHSTSDVVVETGQDGQAKNGVSLPTVSIEYKRPFFVYPFPKAPKHTMSSDIVPTVPRGMILAAVVEKKPSGITEESDATEEEWDHMLRMEQLRRTQEFPRRLATSIVGGIFVIVPMVELNAFPFPTIHANTKKVIMSIDRSLTKCLVTSSISVLLFGLMLAWGSTSDEISLFVAAAGYAAFLAVFVAVGDDQAIKEVLQPSL